MATKQARELAPGDMTTYFSVPGTEQALAWIESLNAIGVGDYMDYMLVEAATPGHAHYVRAVRTNLERGAFAASKGASEREAAEMWYYRAERAFRNPARHNI